MSDHLVLDIGSEVIIDVHQGWRRTGGSPWGVITDRAATVVDGRVIVEVRLENVRGTGVRQRVRRVRMLADRVLPFDGWDQDAGPLMPDRPAGWCFAWDPCAHCGRHASKAIIDRGRAVGMVGAELARIDAGEQQVLSDRAAKVICFWWYLGDHERGPVHDFVLTGAITSDHHNPEEDVWRALVLPYLHRLSATDRRAVQMRRVCDYLRHRVFQGRRTAVPGWSEHDFWSWPPTDATAPSIPHSGSI